MKVSKRNCRDPENNTEFDFEGIEDSLHLGIENIDPVFEPEPQIQDGHDTEGDIFPELAYIEEDDSDTPFTFDSSLV